tara:strand:- start:12300 stop:12533 length:234 start_codon:yes stop_codon:yes gene_type:complete
MPRSLKGFNSFGETGKNDIPSEPTPPEDRRAQRKAMARGTRGTGATRKPGSFQGEHGEDPPIAGASTVIGWIWRRAE